MPQVHAEEPSLRPATLDDAAEVLVLQRASWVTEAIVNRTLDIPALHEEVADVEAWITSLFTGARSERNLRMHERAGYRAVSATEGVVHLERTRAEGRQGPGSTLVPR